MPELPEVEVSRMGISPYLEGETIKLVHVYQASLRWPVPDEVKLTEGLVINKVMRRAKYLLLETVMGSLILHLGMSGKLRVIDKSVPRIKHDHIDIEMETGKILRFNDPRRFGCFLFQPPGQVHKLLANLGPEPLTLAFNYQDLYNKSRDKKTAIKQFLMNNINVVGVGNIYANEALFKAGIHPQMPAGKVSKKRYEKLVFLVKETLDKAIVQGGTTLKDFAQTDGKPGYFAQELLVYGRGGLPCKVCTKPLTEIKIGQRSSVFCDECQKR
ncbi:bifunctional DNA-formamidopyrimidine glycosylase/DNA-(apurinic or apyrimidinic site) lyase [Pseudoalteromonas denitrificans]|uniref:Formamidopyrimidine-DNA glycosylase n=1 Tax=Pseudoalteromonas denitrificans DSM 6059 TaxID=1123010 RepID=A0A1I1JVV0_9GAMM|nr:bifunctional DNA-formamidopyrimidine glycosylase/DNA-(apurinic or apyrimidinic site) lyase [Pseudoalteromonas denitrificans]SFC52704.1 DNA-(apurinic or apyrimidinic site) lyase [Pseudoalteromonas denitrificans DSM 6059]